MPRSPRPRPQRSGGGHRRTQAPGRRTGSAPAAEHDPIELELDVASVAHGGVFVARHEGRVVFVSDTMPGERVLARVSDTRHDRFWRAETVRVLQPSEHRREHVWSAASVERDPAERAGGAEFGHIELGHQRTLKHDVIADALHRMAGVEDTSVVEPAPGDDERGGIRWRSRVRLQVDDAGAIGPFAARSHRVVPVDDLPLAIDAVERAAPLGEQQTRSGSIDVTVTSEGFVSVTRRDADGQAGRRPLVIHERVGDRRFALEATGFWQVHRKAPEVLTAAVQGAVDDSLFDPRAFNLDLYGGVGLLAAAIGDRFGPTTRITSVESDENTTDHAAANLADWIGAQTVTARVEHYLRDLATRSSAGERARLRAGTVVLDPPRSGAGRETVELLAGLAPAQLVYVACDPVAFARDLGWLRERGYELAGARALDLFPHTHHVEMVASLVRAD
ncbi:class I SAM-dependent RNA methyltransferase [Humibacter ginsenosidimutans]|uniref:Class I SAM-dependent RNA methyltransferase n=1 Tax=Humibacter ginsenosidimutans TaxID=2599293 RepID=A0A5B8M7J6_9MICO|nr:class I SAM-dependent RNA methyltransferase [Humibacter ginsenosidimutans]QDZ16403.1 class I SAM-dependent RNA methyltransferase [Humibacter ginsenosidimutans]